MESRSLLPPTPYLRLAALLEGIAPAKPPLALHIGEPQNDAPPEIAPIVADAAALWSRYPTVRGSDALRAAIAQWLTRRYCLPAGMIDPERHVLPLCGAREGLFLALMGAVAWKRARLPVGARPVIALPNPLYHVYHGAAALMGAEVVCPPTRSGSPDFAALPDEVLSRVALALTCSPANPTGAVASADHLRAVIALARRYDFLFAADECYSELWFEAPPPGVLEVAVGSLEGSLERVLVFNSLSKRSSAPGLRSGFVTGDPAFLDDLALLRGYGGAQTPGPLQAAAAWLWRDEAHVARNRAHYRALRAVAQRILGDVPGFQLPDAGFFLWSNVTVATGLDGEAVAQRLWAEQGLKVMPGRYMALADATGVSPGDAFVRVALTLPLEAAPDACARLRAVLGGC